MTRPVGMILLLCILVSLASCEDFSAKQIIKNSLLSLCNFRSDCVNNQ